MHATAQAAAGHRAGSHPNLFVFATQRWRRSVREGEVLLVLPSLCGVPQPHRCVSGAPGSGSTASQLFSTTSAAPRVWDSLLSSVGVEHH